MLIKLCHLQAQNSFQWLWTALRVDSKVLIIAYKSVSCLSALIVSSCNSYWLHFSYTCLFFIRHSMLTHTCGSWACISLPEMLSHRNEYHSPSFSFRFDYVSTPWTSLSIENISNSNPFFAPLIFLFCSIFVHSTHSSLAYVICYFVCFWPCLLNNATNSGTTSLVSRTEYVLWK